MVEGVQTLLPYYKSFLLLFLFSQMPPNSSAFNLALWHIGAFSRKYDLHQICKGSVTS